MTYLTLIFVKQITSFYSTNWVKHVKPFKLFARRLRMPMALLATRLWNEFWKSFLNHLAESRRWWSLSTAWSLRNGSEPKLKLKMLKLMEKLHRCARCPTSHLPILHCWAHEVKGSGISLRQWSNVSGSGRCGMLRATTKLWAPMSRSPLAGPVAVQAPSKAWSRSWWFLQLSSRFGLLLALAWVHQYLATFRVLGLGSVPPFLRALAARTTSKSRSALERWQQAGNQICFEQSCEI